MLTLHKERTVSHEGRFSSLCRPDKDRSCFACCPPIRPAGYDHADHRSDLIGKLDQNTRALELGPLGAKAITGFSCWGLGFLDRERTLAGCLLHPAQNQGRDLRDLTGYGEKCRRELCPEASLFSALPPGQAVFVLTLTRGLDSFEYSSPIKNRAFCLLRWGPLVIERLAALEPGGLARAEFRSRWAVLDRELTPERDGFAVEVLLRRLSLMDLNRPPFLARYKKALSMFIAARRAMAKPPLDNRPFVHQLDLPPSLARFLRSQLGLPRATASQARELKRAAETMLDGL